VLALAPCVAVALVSSSAPAEHPKHFDRALKSHHGKWFVCDEKGYARANRDRVLHWEMFDIRRVPGSPNLVTLSAEKDGTTYYVTAEPNGTMRCNRTQADAWERFELIKHERGFVTLESHHGRYVAAEKSGILRADRTEIHDWERFEVFEVVRETGEERFESYWTDCSEDAAQCPPCKSGETKEATDKCGLVLSSGCKTKCRRSLGPSTVFRAKALTDAHWQAL